MTTLRKWTFMVYMAGDNGKIFDDGRRLMADLQNFGWMNMADMAKVGSTDQVAIVTQFDTLDQRQYTPRFYIDKSSEYGQLIEKISPVNTGDPKNLTEFIVWAEKNYPAEKYALILWNHGTGWNEDDIYARYKEKIEKAESQDEVRSGHRGEQLLKRALFISTVGEIMGIEDSEIRGICYDDSSMSFLDNQALGKALADAQAATGNRLTLIGMDACLMSMVEVACQIQPYADVMVGSQEVEQGEGWPYEPILQQLTLFPDMTAAQLGKVIVTEFGNYYLGASRNGGGINTQSAISLQDIPGAIEIIKTVAEMIEQTYSQDFKIELAVGRARRRVQAFHDPDYIDFRHFIEQLTLEYSGKNAELTTQLEVLAQCLTPGFANGVTLENFHGASRPNANGISIYFPTQRYSPYYDKQKFVASGWNRMLKQVNEIEPVTIDVVPLHQSGRNAGSIQIECPICQGRVVIPDNLEEITAALGAKGMLDSVSQILAQIHDALQSPTQEANHWIDLPCPHCVHTFQYNLKTGESRP